MIVGCETVVSAPSQKVAQNKTKNIRRVLYCTYCIVQCKQWPEDLGGILSLNQQDFEVSKGSRFYNKKVWGPTPAVIGGGHGRG